MISPAFGCSGLYNWAIKKKSRGRGSPARFSPRVAQKTQWQSALSDGLPLDLRQTPKSSKGLRRCLPVSDLTFSAAIQLNERLSPLVFGATAWSELDRPHGPRDDGPARSRSSHSRRSRDVGRQSAFPHEPNIQLDRSRRAIERTRSRVFALPSAIDDIAYQNKAVIYDLLFKASSKTILTIAADPKHLGARIGITPVLHS